MGYTYVYFASLHNIMQLFDLSTFYYDFLNFWIIIFLLYFPELPEIQKFFFQDNIVEGKVVSVMCLAVSEVKPLKFQWDKNGQVLKETEQNIRIENSSEFSVLIINGANYNNEGNYTCTATNTFGSAKHSTYLSVKGNNAKLYLLSYLIISLAI